MSEEKMVIIREEEFGDPWSKRAVAIIKRDATDGFCVDLKEQERRQGAWKDCHYTDGDSFMMEEEEARKLYDVLKEVFDAGSGKPKGKPPVKISTNEGIPPDGALLVSGDQKVYATGLDPQEKPPSGNPYGETEIPTDLSDEPECECCFCRGVKDLRDAPELKRLVGYTWDQFDSFRRRLNAAEGDIKDLYDRMGIEIKWHLIYHGE